VSNEELFANQLLIKDVLLKASDDLMSSSLSFYLTLSGTGLDDSVFEINQVNTTLLSEVALIAPFISTDPNFEEVLRNYIEGDIEMFNQIVGKQEHNHE
jgi:hypothetical protein